MSSAPATKAPHTRLRPLEASSPGYQLQKSRRLQLLPLCLGSLAADTPTVAAGVHAVPAPTR
jgi:hypothetical protein